MTAMTGNERKLATKEFFESISQMNGRVMACQTDANLNSGEKLAKATVEFFESVRQLDEGEVAVSHMGAGEKLVKISIILPESTSEELIEHYERMNK